MSKHYGIDANRSHESQFGKTPVKRARYELSSGQTREYQVFVHPEIPGGFFVSSIDIDPEGHVIEGSTFPIGVFGTEEELKIFKQNFDHGHKLLSSEGF